MVNKYPSERENSHDIDDKTHHADTADWNFLQITRFRSCTVTNWSTKRLHILLELSWITLGYYGKILRKNAESKSSFWLQHSWMATTWMFSETIWAFRQCRLNWDTSGILVWLSGPPSANSGTMMIGWKLDIGENESFLALPTSCFFCFGTREGNNVENHYIDNRILLEGFSSIR